MNWARVCADPSLQDLPYKIELNKQGQVIMSPATIRHLLYQREILLLLEKLTRNGKALPEFPLQTDDGTKVVDVVWLTNEQAELVKDAISSSIAPKICVEVIFPSNTMREMMKKKILYFERGAEEFWLCDREGSISFYSRVGSLPTSRMVPDFPCTIQI